MPASASSSTTFTISEFRRCGGDPGNVARSIVSNENVSALASASRAAFKTSGNESGHFSETAAVAMDAVWKAMVDEEGECVAAAARILSGLMRVLDEETAKKAAAHFLFRFAVASSDEEHVEDLDGAVQSVESWLRKSSSSSLASIVEELLVPMEAREVTDLARRMLGTDRVKWGRFVRMLAVALKCFPGIEMCIKELSSSLLRAGLEKNGGDDFEEFKRGMIIARTGCIVGCDAFYGGYANWFAKTFGDEQTSLATPKRRYASLLASLTSLVPAESAMCLRAHLNRPPFVPFPMRNSAWSDYANLARTRIADIGQQMLRERQQRGGEHERGGAPVRGDSAGEEAAADVEKAVEQFKRTGKMPPTVAKFSIFRKEYFVGEFVPCLLRMRKKGSDSARALVELLLKEGKVSAKLIERHS